MIKSKSKITLKVRVATGDIFEIEFYHHTKARELLRFIAQNLNIRENEWTLALHSEKETIYFTGNERLAEFLYDAKDAYFGLYPIFVGG